MTTKFLSSLHRLAKPTKWCTELSFEPIMKLLHITGRTYVIWECLPPFSFPFEDARSPNGLHNKSARSAAVPLTD